MIETSLCLECGTDTLVNGYVNRVSADRDNINGYMCGMCISTWDLRDMWDAEGNKVYCPATDEEEPEINEDNYDDYEYEFCDEAEQIHIKQWHPEVDEMFPNAPAFRKLMEDEQSWNSNQIKEMTELLQKYERN